MTKVKKPALVAFAIVLLALMGHFIDSAVDLPLDFIVPDFRVNVVLDPADANALAAAHEEISAVARFSGRPRANLDIISALSWVNRHSGAISLGRVVISLPASGGLADFQRVRVASKKVEVLEGRHFTAVITVVSSRLASPDNLLACQSLEAPIDDLVATRQTEIHCHLKATH